MENELFAVLDPNDFDISEAAEWLDHYYEAAGFSDYHAHVLSKMNDQQVLDHFCETFCTEEALRGSDYNCAEDALSEIRK